MRRRRTYRRSGPTLVSPYAPARALPRWRRLVGWLCLVSAIGLCAATVILVITAPPVSVASPADLIGDAGVGAPTLPPVTAVDPTIAAQVVEPPAEQPTISAAQIVDLLATPPQPVAGAESLRYDPFTLVTNRARSKMTTYIAQRGDTIDGIANRYGLKKESIAWCND